MTNQTTTIMKSITQLLGSLLLAAFVLTGCKTTTVGTKLEPSKVAQIKKGVTTRAELEQLFGPPTAVAIKPEGKRELTYQFNELNMHANNFIPGAGLFVGTSDTKSQTLTVVLTAAGVVEDFEFLNTASAIGNGSPGEKK
jgi:outer membrane protein assembly factor BamE (lipoprotein component of BamABCDE complex)